MAEKTQSKTERDLSSVRKAVKAFDVGATFGTYKMDAMFVNIIGSEPSRLRLVKLRNFIRLDCENSLGHKLFRKAQKDDIQSAKQFFDLINSIKANASLLAEINPTWLANKIDHLPSLKRKLHFEDAYRNADDAMLAIYNEAVSLGEKIERYVAENSVASIEKESNRIDHFIHSFIRQFKDGWSFYFGRDLDRDALEALLIAALCDFEYPFRPLERRSTKWLTDRIRTHKSGN